MWEKSLIESKKNPDSKKKWFGWPVSIAFHGSIIGAICIASFWNIAALSPVQPQTPVVFQTFVVPTAPPALGNRGTKRPEHPAASKSAVLETPVLVPEQNSDVPPESVTNENAYDNNSTIDSGGPGVPWGVEGGDPNATSDGVPGGLPVDEPPRIITPDVQQPVLITKIEPPYPHLARITRKEGIVILQAVITKTGTVEELTLLRSADPLLDQAAMSAVKQWIYKPATINGRPIKVYFTVTVNFKLR